MSAIEEMAKAIGVPYLGATWDRLDDNEKAKAIEQSKDALNALILHLKGGAPEMVEAFCNTASGHPCPFEGALPCEDGCSPHEPITNGLIAALEAATKGEK